MITFILIFELLPTKQEMLQHAPHRFIVVLPPATFLPSFLLFVLILVDYHLLALELLLHQLGRQPLLKLQTSRQGLLVVSLFLEQRTRFILEWFRLE